MAEPKTAQDLIEAVQLAEDSLDIGATGADAFQLVAARRMLDGGESCTTTRCWQLTFKRSRLLPTSTAARLGAGGETFCEVDLLERTVTILGHGE